MELLQWWNLIFLLPAFAALLYLLLLALGALPAEGGDGDIDVDAEPGLHVEVHGAHIAIHSGDLPDDFGHESDTDPFRGALSLIGVGRVPLSLVLMSFFFLWGFFGWAANQLLASVLPSPALFIWPSLAVALLGAVVGTRFLAMGLGRLMPKSESYGASSSDLVGRIADVRYALTETNGTVQLYDGYGAMHEVPARVMAGEAPIPSGERVVLWRYDPAGGNYFAVQDDVIAGIEPGAAEPARLSGR